MEKLKYRGVLITSDGLSQKNKVIIVAFLILAIFTTNVNSQDAYWIEAIGGIDTEKMNYAPSIIVTDDGYIAIGYSDAFGNGTLDFFIVKLDKYGGYLGSRVICGPWKEEAYTIEQTIDGGYFITGFTEQSHQYPQTADIIVIKLYSDLTLEWAKRIGTVPGSREASNSGRCTYDGGYIITSGTFLDSTASGNDVLIVKLNANGELVWAKTIGSSENEHGEGIERTPDSGYVIVGLTSAGAGPTDVLVIKIDQNGNLEWARIVGGAGLECSNWDGIRQTQNGGYVIGGKTTSFGAGDENYFLVKLQSNANLDWCRVIGESRDDACWTITPTSDGGYIAGGRFQDPDHPYDPSDVLLVRLDNNAQFVWATKLADNKFQEIEEVKEIENGYVIAGATGVTYSTGLDFLVAKLDTEGLVPGSGYTTHITPNIISPSLSSIPISLTTKDVTSQVNVIDFTPPIITPAIRIDTLAMWIGAMEGISHKRPTLCQIYPNPFTSSTTIRYSVANQGHVALKIYNLGGQLVRVLVNKPQKPGDYTVKWDGKDDNKKYLRTGIYFVKLNVGEFSQVKKSLLLRQELRIGVNPTINR